MTTIYYSIVERATGVMELGRSNVIDHTDRALAGSLAYAPLNDLLVKALVSVNPEDHADLQPIDFKQTHWDFATNSWVIVWDVIPDVSIKFKTVLDAFIAEVSSISITAENVRDVVLPVEIPK